ncbi:hypothetical protein KTT_48760 [Tengunoibacter tsumagoiensis]|uniref:Uncharacterized protein n=1 Tax=Tengunoibacter tsumagoiensis TaxID=2014871 RepID=A0A402A794_9CHLR|nr:hypothetical protein KTT_48760 [Tengunoibacter tsumagoiensis]
MKCRFNRGSMLDAITSGQGYFLGAMRWDDQSKKGRMLSFVKERAERKKMVSLEKYLSRNW